MSMMKELSIEQLNRDCMDIKVSDLNNEIVADKYSNNFAVIDAKDIMEEYDDRLLKQERHHQLDGFHVFNI
jgi:hypothetical protein